MPGRRATSAAIAFAWVGVLFYGFYPGVVPTDAVDMIRQGVSGQLTTWHSPFVAWLLGWSVRLVGSPALVLLLQLSLFAAALAVLCGGRPLLLLAILALPTTWTMAVAVLKDSLLVAVLLAAVAALRLRRSGIALALVALGSTVRLNALAATLPLVFPIVASMLPGRGGRTRVIGIVVAAALLVTTPLLTSMALGARKASPYAALLTFDLAGLYVRHPEAFPGSRLSRDLSIDRLRSDFDFGTGDFLLWNRDAGTRKALLDFSEPRVRDLERDWRAAVRRYPMSYLHDRALVVAVSAGMGPLGCGPFALRTDPNPWGLETPATGVARALGRVASRLETSPLFRAWPWFLLAFGAAWIARRRAPLASWTSISAVAYALPYTVLLCSCGFRFFYWTAGGALASVALLAGSFVPTVRGSASSSGPPRTASSG